MQTFAAASLWRHSRIRITTERSVDFIDITAHLESLVSHAGIDIGVLNVQSLHTTTAVVINEHEPLLLDDFKALLERAAPREASYRHDDFTRRTNVVSGERVNGHSHCRALLLTPSACLNIADGRLQLGRWQRVFFLELDGPQTRDLSVAVFGEGAR